MAIQRDNLGARNSEATKAAGDPPALQVQVMVDPVSFSAAVALGELYLKQGQKDEALKVKAFMLAIQVKPKNPQPYNEIGRILFENGDLTKATEYFDKYIALGGKEAKVKAILSRK